MFGTLFAKECKQILKSMVYYIYVVVFVLFLSSQLGEGLADEMEKPEQGQEYYGMVKSHDETVIMEKTLAGLVQETSWNSYATYPMGFYKGVKLSNEELSKMEAIIEECTGKSWEQVVQEMEDHYSKYDQSTMEGAYQAQTTFSVVPKETLTYEEFCENMDKVCNLIGKGSSYQKTKFESGAYVPMTYEEAMEEYEALCSKDKITGATSRLFCDYASIILAVLPIFMGVTRCLRDKRAQVNQVVFARKASAVQIIGSRYLANVCMAFLPVIITAFVMQMPYAYHAKTMGVTPDYFAFLKYSAGWLLPEIMIVLAVSFLITECTENVFSIFVQVFWAVASLFGAVSLEGNFGLMLIARWNQLGGTNEFWQQKSELFLNRGFYFGLSLLCIVLTIAVYEKKRREGETIYGKIFKRRK